MVSRLDHRGDTLRLQHLLNGVGDLRRQAFLDLQPLGINLNDARKLGNTYHAAIRHIGDPGTTNDRRNVMFAMTFERNTAENDHLVIAVRLLEGLLKDQLGVLTVAGKVFLKGANQTTGGFTKTVSIGVFTDPAKDLSKRLLDFQL